MRPNSEINEVHTSYLGDRYETVKSYLCDDGSLRPRSYRPYIDSVYRLRDADRSITFQSELLLPNEDRGRPHVLLLFSNAHPKSIKNGMFHTAEGRVAALWTDLCKVGLFSGDTATLESPERLREHCLSVAYNGRFAFGFACYWIFPTFDPDHLRKLFGPEMKPPGSEDPKVRLNRLLAKWQPNAIISFNGQVLEAMTGAPSAGYLESLRDRLVQRTYQAPEGPYRVFQTYPAGWRFRRGIIDLRRASLGRIRDAILRNE